jgi:hypothetical protein
VSTHNHAHSKVETLAIIAIQTDEGSDREKGETLSEGERFYTKGRKAQHGDGVYWDLLDLNSQGQP